MGDLTPSPPHLRGIRQNLETILLGRGGAATDIWWMEAEDTARHPITQNSSNKGLSSSKQQ